MLPEYFADLNTEMAGEGSSIDGENVRR